MRTVALLTVVSVCCFALGFIGSVAAGLVLDAIREWRHRGEAAEAPDPDPFDQDAGRFVGRAPAPVPLPSVPYGTGEQLARELTDYLKGRA